MAITEKRPSTKYTVGAQYICFNATEWSASAFESDVTKLPTVVDIDVADNADSYESYASGQVYDSDTIVTYKDIKVTLLRLPCPYYTKPAGGKKGRGGISNRRAPSSGTASRSSRRTARRSCSGSPSANLSKTLTLRRPALRSTVTRQTA